MTIMKVVSGIGKHLGIVGAVCLAVMALAGCQSPSAATRTNALAKLDPAEVLQVGESVLIDFEDLPTGTGSQVFNRQIKADGSLSPLMENHVFYAAGKTRTQLEDEIRKFYVPDYYQRLTVTVRPQGDTRVFYVGGEVRTPGAQKYIPGVTVSKAIESAGGFTQFANKKKVKLIRADGKHILTVNCNKVLVDPTLDPEVFPGDKIYVRRRFW